MAPRRLTVVLVASVCADQSGADIMVAMTTTDLSQAVAALTAVIDSEAPTTKKGAQKLVKALIANGVEPLRDYLDELTSAIETVESNAGEFEEADSEDRFDYHDQVVASADDLRDLLAALHLPTIEHTHR